MKKLLSFIVAFALCVTLFAPLTVQAADDIVPEKAVGTTIKKMKTIKSTFKAGNAKATIETSFPVIIITDNAKATKKLYSATKKYFYKDVIKYFKDSANNNWFEKGDKLTITVDVEESVDCRMGNCLNLEAIATTALDKSAYPVNTPFTAQFDLTTGKRVAFNKLFNTKDLYKYLTDEIMKQIKATKEVYSDLTEELYDDIKAETILKAFEDEDIALSFDSLYMYMVLSEDIVGPHAFGTPIFSVPIDDVITYSIARDQLLYPLTITKYDFATNAGIPYHWEMEVVKGEDVVSIVDCGTFAEYQPGLAGGPCTARFIAVAQKPGTATLRAKFVDFSGKEDKSKTQEWDVIVIDNYFITEVNGEW